MPPALARTTADPAAPPGLLALRGELDFLTAGQLRTRVALAAARHPALTLDLTGATVYDRDALNALAHSCADAERAGCRLTCLNPPRELAERLRPHTGHTRVRRRGARIARRLLGTGLIIPVAGRRPRPARMRPRPPVKRGA